jgi:hypothetical protein
LKKIIFTSLAILYGDLSFSHSWDYSNELLRGNVKNFQNSNTFGEGNHAFSFDSSLGIGSRYHGVQIDHALSNRARVGNALYADSCAVKVALNFFHK